MDSHFVSVFDIAQKHPDWHFLMAPALAMLVFLGFVIRELLTKRRFNRLLPWCFVCLISFIVAYGFYKGSRYGMPESIAALRDGRASVVEGRVQDFVPMPLSGHSEEQFTVDGVRFHYSDFLVQPCFNNTSSHGGPIRADIWVRISYVGNCILRVEVWQPATPESHR